MDTMSCDHARRDMSNAAGALKDGTIDQDTHDEIMRKSKAYLKLHGAMSAGGHGQMDDHGPMGGMGPGSMKGMK